MKRVIFYMAALGLSLVAFPRTEGEKLDVARQMAIWVQSSSNRLETALFVLSQTNCPPRLTEYFTAVTNQMLSSGQPLAVLDVGE